ncbi:MAG TPA: ATP-binding protein [Chitinophagales bacterium]|nr:ATP-binding protein [Chitinophagales bacterium]
MTRNIKFLILEHDPSDIDLIKYELNKSFGNNAMHVVQNQDDFTQALHNFCPDIILSDYSLPTFDGLSAFKIKQEIRPDTPFILVSGTVGEENAVEFIKTGITDYALKDKLYSLEPKIVRALNEAHEREQKRQAQEALKNSESNLRAIFQNTDVGFLFLNTDYRVVAYNYISQQWAMNLLGHHLTENTNFKNLLQADKLIAFNDFDSRIMNGRDITCETNFKNPDGSLKWYSVNGKPILDKDRIIGTCIAITDITRRKMAEEEILKLNSELEHRVEQRTYELVEANKALEAFSYSVSHDLRSPVRSVMGFTSLIQAEHGHSLNPDLKQLFSHIESSSKRMNTIIDDLLVLAKYGKEPLNIGPVNLTRLFYSVWDNHLFTAPHNAKLEMQELPVVTGDGSMLEQVLVNMVSNAVKYSSKIDKPVVRVGFTETEDSVTIYVQDNGAGFDMKNYNRLFGAFQRLHGLSEFEGSGVGLMIIKRIIDRHGGQVWAEGKVNGGATFYFSLPKQVTTAGNNNGMLMDSLQ